MPNVLPPIESEGKLTAVAFKIPEGLLERLDAAAQKTNRNRTQAAIRLLQFALDAFDAEQKA